MGLLDDLFDVFFPRKQYGTSSTTKLGVQVRSRAEQRIGSRSETPHVVTYLGIEPQRRGGREGDMTNRSNGTDGRSGGRRG